MRVLVHLPGAWQCGFIKMERAARVCYHTDIPASMQIKEHVLDVGQKD